MADKKTTLLPPLDDLQAGDLLYVVDDPEGTPISSKMYVSDLFGNTNRLTLPAVDIAVTADFGITAATFTFAGNVSNVGTFSNIGNVTVQGNVTVNGNANSIAITSPETPSDLINTDGKGVGTIMWDSSYIYVVTGAAEVKRVAFA
jgi:hypothetical protein